MQLELKSFILNDETNLKDVNNEIKENLELFNVPSLSETKQYKLRKKLAKLYINKGYCNTNRKEFLEAILDFTKSLEFNKTKIAFHQRAILFLKFCLTEQARSDILNALKCCECDEEKEIYYKFVKDVLKELNKNCPKEEN